MYCGSCLHDNTLAAELQEIGHDVALIPTYTPVRTDETNVSIDRVFYGAVNVYLEQKSSFFEHTPGIVHSLLDRPGLLNWISGRGVSIDPHELGDLTLSVLKGEEGRQRRELHELVDWLRDSFKPDIVHITNSMLMGMAEPIKQQLGVPVVCSVQGEDLFLEDLVEPYKSQVHQLLCAQVRHADAVVATSDYYADFMAEYLGLPRDQVRVIKLGINLEGHGQVEGSAPDSSSDSPTPPRVESDSGDGSDVPAGDNPFVVGYLARVCPEKGLHILAEAFKELTERVGRNRVRLRAAGWLGKRDREYLNEVRDKLASWGLGDRFKYVGEVSRAEKIEFLQGLDALCVPTLYKEPKGLFVLEALANGVPVVQPSHGAFPEMIEATGGGLLADPNLPSSLADHLAVLMADPDLRNKLGGRGKEAVRRLYSDTAMAEATLGLYEECVRG